ncbi:prenyltransferase/squalene oxidase repeat-containing protein [Streptomyces marokkonensis]|uniref:Prenyltransferase/squalene oxidase repeat-containing protein n=1 Tax=Streptomyces marokkonensis TaxID=324855 RepID=A0ABW6QG83_9ACTN
MLAVCVDSPGADPGRLLATVTAVDSRTELKQWQRALLAAAEIISRVRLGVPVPDDTIEALEQEQGADGGYCLMPGVTGLAYLAFSRLGDGHPAGRRCLDFLLRAQRPDGTWRYLSFDIWDTTLMVRSLRGISAFDTKIRKRALDFIEETQSADGGWACKLGLESDNDTTASAMIALAGTVGSQRGIPFAVDYLRRVQREDGLWTTWQSADDVPAPDVVAHIKTALDSHPSTGMDTTRASDWLLSQGHLQGGWSAHWYPSRAYAVVEIAQAVGWQHEVSRRAARELAAMQRPDGGWPVFRGATDSAPAVTGLALSALVRARIGVPTRVFENAAAYLVETQTPEGTWPGVPIMAGPRPFLNHCPQHTHAFVSAGLRDLVLGPAVGDR